MSKQSNDHAVPHVRILGTRGIPAAHGGFETFTENLAPYLVRRGWSVTVYCQIGPDDPGFSPGKIAEDHWRGVRRVLIHEPRTSAFGTVLFDWRSVRHAMTKDGLVLVLGYNTAIFSALLRLARSRVVMNMDGIEWSRAKWSLPYKIWFYINERLGILFAHHLIADHPEIRNHLKRYAAEMRMSCIAYGADAIEEAEPTALAQLGIEPYRFFVSIARIEPENSILEIVRAFKSKPRSTRLVVLGTLDPQSNAYHRAVAEAAGDGRDVVFPGSIFEPRTVRALRFYTCGYTHGHTVGGTNPSLVEALGAGSPVIAHDNRFNRYVAGDDQLFFSDMKSCALAMDQLENDDAFVGRLRAAARRHHEQLFTWGDILGQYDKMLRAQLALGMQEVGKIAWKIHQRRSQG